MVVGDEGNVSQVVGFALGHVGGAFMGRRSGSRASVANMLVELELERLHEFLKFLQGSGGLVPIIRDGGAKVAGRSEARVRAIKATKILTGGWAIVTAKVRTKRGAIIVAKVTAIRAVSTARPAWFLAGE